ncbi:hypothetical protein SAMN02745130_01785 [Thiothrix eikelboomii]|uniref:Uncharacterized protein n=1 Tax=Thiothrix eikelboomii TaxID=92487 RepID=A0A1T4WJ47_9GAMM|nr:hypothetical protein [Thiothrix eikelboomii]SKA77353.1 hypothetical protein SAMN02745130_01785 [Thiothrix eikelboomii]
MKLKSLLAYLALILGSQQATLAADLQPTADQTPSNLASSAASLTRATGVNPKIYGKTIGNWGHAWWEWAFNIPKANNPLFQNGAMDCSVGQKGKVWFLAGNFGETSSRSCTIPQGKALFFPIYNSVWWTPAPGTEIGCKDETDCRQAVNASILSMQTYTCRINGEACIWHYPIVRAQSENLPFKMNADSILVTEYEEIPVTRETSISDGYWVMLPPLPVGNHRIRFTAKATDFALDVTYKLSVQ